VRSFRIIALIAAISGASLAGARSKTPAREMKLKQQAEIAGLVSASAQQKCENWAWAAALETALKAQGVNIPQSSWIAKADGGEVCKDQPADIESLAKTIEGEYALDDGRKVRIHVQAVSGAPANLGALIAAARENRPLIFFWKNHAYVYRGLEYNEMVTTTGTHEFEVEHLELLDPFFDTAEKQAATFERDKDNPADINGMLDLKVTPIEGPDWMHPDNAFRQWDAEHPH
jgi:hypothetical protein